MPDTRFFPAPAPFTAADVLFWAAAEAGRGEDRLETIALFGVAPLSRANAGDLSYAEGATARSALRQTGASAVIVPLALADEVPDGAAVLLSAEPRRAFAIVARRLYPDAAGLTVAPDAPSISPSARIDAGAQIAPGVIIGAHAEIGADTVIDANAIIGAGVVIGAACRIGAHVSISHAIVGAGTTVHPGARIGQPGFGFVIDPAGHLTVPQLGRVLIGSDVEIGANTTIDRGSLDDTVIGDGCRIDNLVQIGHNVRLGKGCVLAAQTGLSGSVTVGDFAVFGGQAGIADHVEVGSGARVGAQAGVMKSVPPGVTVSGTPSLPIKEHWRQVATLQRLSREKGAGRKE